MINQAHKWCTALSDGSIGSCLLGSKENDRLTD
jgi:hypothetical protein